MEDSTKDILYEAWGLCEEENRANEYTVAFMSEKSKLPINEVSKFILDCGYVERIKWYIKNRKQNN